VPNRLAQAAFVLTGPAALAVGAAEIAGSAALPPASAPTHTSAPVGGPLIRRNSHEALPLKGGSVQSSNWSGSAVTPSGDNVTAVTSTFTVPTAGLVVPGFTSTTPGTNCCPVIPCSSPGATGTPVVA
jgi:hypothetical protein